MVQPVWFGTRHRILSDFPAASVQATLLLLGIGIAIPLFTSGVIWKAIYDTLQEGDQPPPL